MQRRLHLPLIDTLWLVLLCAYALAGMMLVPFHPDETEHLRMSQDYFSIFQDGNLAAVANVVDPVTQQVLPGDPTVSIQAAPLHSFVTGFILQLSGQSRADLPLPWNWGQDYKANAADGRLPTTAVLAAGRLAATLFFCVSILAMYGLGRLFGTRWLAVVAATLYALNPILLEHGRRAMLEGGLLCFGLLTLLIAGVISTRRPGERLSGWWWAALALVAGLGMTAKYTYAVIFAAALAWIIVSRVLAWVQARQFGDRRPLVALAGRLIFVGVGAAVIFVALTPALWSNPPARIVDALHIVGNILASQVRNNQTIALSLPQRFLFAARLPFLTPVEPGHTVAETLRYSTSLLHGITLPVWMGLIFTGLAVVGLITELFKRFGFARREHAPALRIGLLAWLGAAALTAAQTPLPWQRYFVTVVPLGVLLAELGLFSLLRMAQRAALSYPGFAPRLGAGADASRPKSAAIPRGGSPVNLTLPRRFGFHR